MGDFKSDLANLGEIKMVKENGVSVIQFKQFIKITKVVYSCHERLSKRLREQFDCERRQLFIKKDWVAYEKFVGDQHMRDGKALDDIIAVIVAELGIKLEVFEQTL